MATLQQATDLEMLLSTDEEVREMAPAQKPQRYFLKSLVGAAVLGGLAFCGSKVFGQDNAKAPTQFYGQTIELADDVDPDMAVVQGLMGAWGMGKFHGDGCLDSAKKFFADDVITDARAPSFNTDMYKEYKGLDGLCEWCKNLEVFNFSTFNLTQMYVTEGDKVMAIASYVPTLMASGQKAGKPVEDGQIWTVTDGKISHVTFLFTGIKTIDGLLGDKPWEPSAKKPTMIMTEMLADWGKGKFAGDDCEDTAEKIVGTGFVSKDSTWEEGWKGPEGYCKWNHKNGAKMAKMKHFTSPVLYERAKGEVLMESEFEFDGKKSMQVHLWNVNDDGMITEHRMVATDPTIFH